MQTLFLTHKLKYSNSLSAQGLCGLLVKVFIREVSAMIQLFLKLFLDVLEASINEVLFHLLYKNRQHTFYIICFLFGIFSPVKVLAAFSGGNGTAEAPYQITTITQLDSIRYFPGENFILMNDLDFRGSKFDSIRSTNNMGWLPIDRYRGTFNGQQFKLKNLYIHRPKQDSVGLFVEMDGRIVELGLVNCQITGKDFVGGIAGVVNTLNKCFVSGRIHGRNKVAGLAVEGNNISQCFSTASVFAEEEAAGLVLISKSTHSYFINS
jgi:hypothetical protein